MNLNPQNQLNLYGVEENLRTLIALYDKGNLPSKILLTGQKGVGKCTLAYHLINYILSKDEEFSYNINEFKIYSKNRSFKLITNGTNPNFQLLDVSIDKKQINIDQIRNLLLNIKKSSFNDKPRFILIDNIEYLNKNSVNALLKDLEEPNENIYFILINNQRKLISTLKSRCLNFNISLSNETSLRVINQLMDDDIFDHVNNELINYYFTPGNIYNLNKFAIENEINLKDMKLKEFLKKMIKENYFKKDQNFKYLFYDYLELFLKNISSIDNMDYYSYFVKKIDNIKKYNLDEESLFIEFNEKILNG
jgi:DNA polymerase-3 subunit delta'